MIKAKHIPPESLGEMIRVLSDTGSYAKAAAAMLNAWPGGWIHEREGVTGKTLSFPLTQENNNGSD
jgi:hypothetical protein